MDECEHVFVFERNIIVEVKHGFFKIFAHDESKTENCFLCFVYKGHLKECKTKKKKKLFLSKL